MPDSFGTELRAIDLDRVRISETVIPRGLQIGPHSHEAGQICFVLEGEYRETLAEGERFLTPGTMHVRQPGRLHENRFAADEDSLALVISIDPGRWFGRPFEGPAKLLGEVAEEIRTEMRRGDEIARLALDSLAMLALARMTRLATLPAQPEWLNDALSMIESHHAEALSLSVVARRLGIDRSVVANAFRRYRGMSVGEAIRAARIRRALGMLSTARPLAEIALCTGFHDQSHFTRAFKRTTGLTPADFRRRTRT